MKRNMFAKIGSIVVATTVIVVMGAGVSKAGQNYKETFSGSYTNDPNFSYDGEANNPISYGATAGHDNIEGNFVAQDYFEADATGSGPCTAPDGTAGSNFPLVAENDINTYPSGDQLYLFFATGNDCGSNSTGVFAGTEDGTVIGGSGKLAKASGPIHESYVGVVISAPASPGFGFIATAQATITGTVTR